MSEAINKDRKPTPADLKILSWLQSGQSINNLEAIQKFNNACMRDCAWRLKKAGYPLIAEWVNYETRDGKKKKFKRYFLTPPEIIESGFKTHSQEKKSLNGTKPIAEITRDIQNTRQKAQAIQTSIF